MNPDRSYLISSIEKLGINLTEKQTDQFMTYYEMLIEKNKVMNLTSITEFQDVIIKHFADSLSFIKVLNIGQQKSLIDIGTGAGFPGIPIKIVYPALSIVLLDSLKKRLNFLDEVIEKLELQNIHTLHGRAEDIAHQKEYREKFDLCVSRAVANLSTLCELTLPFVRVNGNFIVYKGDPETTRTEIENAQNAIITMGSTIQEIQSFTLLDKQIQRTLVVIHKERQISSKYPRKAGTPTKDPL